MFGIRTLVFLAGIALAIWILRRLMTSSRATEKPQKKVGRMVRCAQCGMHVPENEALQSDGNYYCSREHRDRDQ